jgi:multiple sugar transport system ATP-binding protein
MTMGDRIAIMDQGVLQQVGPPQAVYDEPANLFVARFIGSPSMNTVAARVAGDGEGVVVDLPGAEVTLPPAIGAAVARAGLTDVVLGVRPEHVRIDGGPVPSTVTVVESLGHERHVVCRLDDGTMVIVRQPSSEAAVRDGSTVRLSLPAENLHVFDAATGRRVTV